MRDRDDIILHTFGPLNHDQAKRLAQACEAALLHDLNTTLEEIDEACVDEHGRLLTDSGQLFHEVRRLEQPPAILS